MVGYLPDDVPFLLAFQFTNMTLVFSAGAAAFFFSFWRHVILVVSSKSDGEFNLGRLCWMECNRTLGLLETAKAADWPPFKLRVWCRQFRNLELITAKQANPAP
jgi:hypothetical protein